MSTWQDAEDQRAQGDLSEAARIIIRRGKELENEVYQLRKKVAGTGKKTKTKGKRS